MKSYKDYKIEDFLLDDSFLDWVRIGCPATGMIWLELLATHPEIQNALNEAKTFIEQQRSGSNLPELTDKELTEHISKVLARTEANPFRVRRLNNYSPWWQVAATVTLFIGLGWGISYWQSSRAPFVYEKLVKSSTIPLTEIINTDQKQQSITLPDGSHITLARGAQISYPTQLDKQPARSVYLRGEAFFEVTKDPHHPFYVYADGLVTRVVGTSFIIQTSRKQVSVIVRSGRVAVYPMKDIVGAEQPKEKLMLTPNQMATFNQEENQLSRAIASQPVSLGPDGQTSTLQFDNTPIADVFTQLEHLYGIPIHYDAAKLTNCFLTSTLTNEPFYSKLDIICKTIGATYKVQDAQIVVISAGCE